MTDGIGIDVTKDKLDCHRFSDGAGAQFANAQAGFQRLCRWIGAAHGSEPDMPRAKDRPVLGELQAARTVPIADKGRLRSQLDRQQRELMQELNRRRSRQVNRDCEELDQAIRAQLDTCPTRKRAL